MSLVVQHTNSANILVISFFSSRSHKITYLPLVEELGKRGHNITLVSPFKPMKEMKNVIEIYTIDIETIFQGDKFNPFEDKEKEVVINPSLMLSIIHEACNRSYDLPEVKQLLNEKFDIVFLTPFVSDCVLGLVYRLKSHLVLFTPAAVPGFMASKIGGHFPYAITPNIMLGYENEMTFKERFISFGVDIASIAYMHYIYEPSLEKLYREKLGADIPSISEIYANASLLLSNGHFSLSMPRPYFPDIIDVGGLHSRPGKPIPKDLEEFINQGKDGFILFSMGTAIKGDSMPEPKRKLLLNAFSKLKQQVIWKWESESMPDLPKNVLLKKWLPQQDLLGHKDIKLFVTHCGGGSTEEAIFHGVPLVGIPILGDQPQNALGAKRKGFLIELSWNNMTEQSLGEAIEEVLTNPKYRNNVKELSALFKDRPIKPLDLAVYWVEYVLRHDGAPYLRHTGRKLNFFSYHSYDVITAYLILLGSAFYLTYALLRLSLSKLCFRKNFSSPSNKEKIN